MKSKIKSIVMINILFTVMILIPNQTVYADTELGTFVGGNNYYEYIKNTCEKIFKNEDCDSYKGSQKTVCKELKDNPTIPKTYDEKLGSVSFEWYSQCATMLSEKNSTYKGKSVYCTYSSSNFRASVEITSDGANFGGGSYSAYVTELKYDNKNIKPKKGSSTKVVNMSGQTTIGDYKFPQIIIDFGQMSTQDDKYCPPYLLIDRGPDGSLTQNKQSPVFLYTKEAYDAAVGELREKGYDDEQINGGESISRENFYGANICGKVGNENCVFGKGITLVCSGTSANSESLFGNPNDAGDGNDRPPSTAYLIKQALNVIRILVIALLIVLGTIDMAKAVFAGQEDEMKKATRTFFKRIIAGICIFLVPTFVTIIMTLADNMMSDKNYTICNFEIIEK